MGLYMGENNLHVPVKESEIKDLKLGQEVTYVVKGKITELTDSRTEEYPTTGGKSKKEKYPPQISIEISSKKLSKPNAFSELAEDEDD